MDKGQTGIQMTGGEIESSICPLFWQHGEEEGALREEIARMQEGGVGAFIVESRPHPDYLSYGWWRDLDVILEEAADRHMGVWIFDDSAYPSGLGGGKVKTLYPEATKRYLACRRMDATGPMSEAMLQVGAWLAEGEELLGVVAAKRMDGRELLEEDTLTDLTWRVKDGILYWDIPEGAFRVFLLVVTSHGGEEWTKDYVNPVSQEAVAHYIDIVYEEHYKRYREKFGRTIRGFFVDEPRFGNASSYESTLGLTGAVYPWSSEVQELLCDRWGGDYKCFLPFLWSRENRQCREVHYTYMDVVSRLFARNFTGQIRSWCSRHGVKVIGHVVEDNGAHARLGFGPGHFFRSMEGFDASGIDIVYQVWPEVKEGFHTTPFGYLDAEFFYWGLGKMASSAAHIDPVKEGLTVCEIFGAYGWQEGLKLMKWLTDHACVRGINVLIPHAFSPKYPDTDCPPHFYAKGHNPQWKYFRRWSDYANRVCHLLQGGIHRATAAVVYHAEMEWGGEYLPFEKVVRVLMEAQIDCDVLPVDCLAQAGKQDMGAGREEAGGSGWEEAGGSGREEASWEEAGRSGQEEAGRSGQEETGRSGREEADSVWQEGAARISRARAADGKLWVGEESYEAVFVPGAACVPRELAEALCRYAQAGVPVVFVDRYPEHIYGEEDGAWIGKLQAQKGVEQVPLHQIAAWMREREPVDVQTADQVPFLRCLHYEKAGEPVYFFTNESKYHTVDTSVSIALTGSGHAGEMAFYDAMEDAFYRIPEWKEITGREGGRITTFRLVLAPYQSVFLVPAPVRTSRFWKQRIPVVTGKDFEAELFRELAGDWQVSVRTQEGGDGWRRLPVTKPGNLAARDLLPRYSGTICYETRFELGAEEAMSWILLDLGEVYEISEVELNGEAAGVRICPPYTYLLSGREGTNVLRVLVTNTLAKEKGDNLFDRAMPQEPSGLLGPVRLHFSRNSFGEQP